jgi:benzil reductase ((S)-benzoin forming)
MSDIETILWISGATSGIGEALAETMPWPRTKVINLSRRAHPTLESLAVDLAEPASWDRVADHFVEQFDGFGGRRAVFLHCAFLREPVGFVGEVDELAYRRHILANATAPLVLGDAFLRACPSDVEAGVIMISSAAARIPYAGRAGYGAGKAAMEQWVRAVRLELAERRPNSWAVAIRPGAVDTPALRADAAADHVENPTAPALRAALEAGTIDSAEKAARRIWNELPPGPDTPTVVFHGEMIAPPDSSS